MLHLLMKLHKTNMHSILFITVYPAHPLIGPGRLEIQIVKRLDFDVRFEIDI